MLLHRENVPVVVLVVHFLQQVFGEAVDVFDIVLGGDGLLAIQHFQVKHQQQSHEHFQVFKLPLGELVLGQLQELHHCRAQVELQLIRPHHFPQVLALGCPGPLVALVRLDQSLQASSI